MRRQLALALTALALNGCANGCYDNPAIPAPEPVICPDDPPCDDDDDDCDDDDDDVEVKETK